ncbi:MAG: hypothetical protein HY344_04570 [Candidatus Levybacteria bacterium]|nr:hypothetical protein [Candidatus Levybacteria bacterium]
MPEDKKIRFIKTFSNLPLNIRNEIIYVFPDKGPITWNVAFIEIINNTPLGKEILEKLDNLNLI